MATVRVPAQLRSLTHGDGEVQAPGTTVSELIDNLDNNFSGIGARLRDETGQLRRFVNIYVNDEDIRFLDGLQTKLTESARVSIIPAVAGGALGGGLTATSM
jgi:molybdopterin synthase sulfur carrier subunit